MVVEIIISILVFILFFPLKFSFDFYINLLLNKGAMSVRIFKIPLAQEKFLISDGEITTKNKRNKETKIELSKEDKRLIFLNLFINSIIRKIILNETYICSEVGKKDDAMATAVISGSVLFVLDMFLAQVFSKKGDFAYSVDNEVFFCQNKLSLCLETVFYTNIFDMLFCFIKSLLKAKKRIKELSFEKLKTETKINISN